MFVYVHTIHFIKVYIMLQSLEEINLYFNSHYCRILSGNLFRKLYTRCSEISCKKFTLSGISHKVRTATRAKYIKKGTFFESCRAKYI